MTMKISDLIKILQVMQSYGDVEIETKDKVPTADELLKAFKPRKNIIRLDIVTRILPLFIGRCDECGNPWDIDRVIDESIKYANGIMTHLGFSDDLH